MNGDTKGVRNERVDEVGRTGDYRPRSLTGIELACK